MKQRARHDLQRRLERLEGPPVGRHGDGDASEWLTDDEFTAYAELRKSGLKVEAHDCQRLLAVARARRNRGEPKGGQLWRVDIEEGRPTRIPRDDGRGYYEFP